MKPMIMAFLGIVSGLLVQAQSVLVTGSVQSDTAANPELYLLFAGPHTKNKSFDLLLNAQHTFSRTIEIPYPVFAIIKHRNTEKKILLSPGRNISIEIKAVTNNTTFKVSGRAKPENELFDELAIGKRPFFMEGEWKDNPYSKQSLDELDAELLQRVQHETRMAERKIAYTEIPQLLQFVLQQEVHYSIQSYLYDFAGMLPGKSGSIREAFLDKVLAMESIPGRATLRSCPFANMMLNNYGRAFINKAGAQLKTNPEEGKRQIEAIFSMPFDSIMAQAQRYDEGYILPWLYAKQQMSRSIHDKLLFNIIMDACDNNQLATATSMLDTLEQYCPGTPYLSIAKPELRRLQSRVAEQALNSKIIFHNKSVGSLQEMVTSYKGKWVYLDIWGTWCPPCKQELQYMPALKKQYAGKNLVFVYLDMDDDQKEQQWKEFVRLAVLEGEHYRLNNNNIQKCWNEIEAAGGTTHRYPTYVLFNPEGKIVNAAAERPSSGDAIRKMLDNALTKQE